MEKRIISLIESIYDLLKENELVKKIYSFSDNEKSLQDVLFFQKHIQFDYAGLWNSFIENIAFVRSFAVETERDDLLCSNVFDLYYEIENTNLKLFNTIEDKLLTIIIETNAMLVLYSVASIREQKIDKLITLSNDAIKLLYRSKSNSYYRGQSDFSYNLIPSIYRNLKEYSGKQITHKDLFDIYKKRNLISRYNDIFGYSNVDYQFCSFMQHSVSYSPYLDFSEDVKIALSFACNNDTVNINDYIHKDAALYEISFSKALPIVTDKDPFSLDVFITSGKLRISSLVRGKPIYLCSHKDFDVDAYLITNKTNDRMKYQKGVFLFFRKCVIVNNIILMPLNFGNIVKYKIPAKAKKQLLTKQGIYELIKESYKAFDYDHLMNPYYYFEDSPLK